MCQPIRNANASVLHTFAVDYPLNVPEQEGQPIVIIPEPSWAITVSGIRVPGSLPQSKRYAYSAGGGKSKDAIGGIIVGVLIGVGAVAGIAIALWIVKRRKGRVAAQNAEPSAVEDGEKGFHLPAEADGTAQISELPPEDRKPELASAELVKLGGGRGKPAGACSREVCELPGDGR